MYKITAGFIYKLYQGCYYMYIAFRLVHYTQAQLIFKELMLCCAHCDLNQEAKISYFDARQEAT